MSQRALAEKSGVSAGTINELENARRKPHAATLVKLAEGLGVEVDDLMKEVEKVEVEVGKLDDEGVYRGAMKLRFSGEVVGAYDENGDTRVYLYECPDGFRVYLDDGSTPERILYPNELNRNSGEIEYPLYSAEEVVRDWPRFRNTTAVLPVRDLD